MEADIFRDGWTLTSKQEVRILTGRSEPGSDPRLLINIFGGDIMLKTRFLQYCRKHNEAICGMHVRIGRFNREIFPTVELYGTWGRYDDDGEWLGFTTSVTLFTPQHKKDDFRTWNDTCEARAVKFRKWLEEWYQENPSTRKDEE